MREKRHVTTKAERESDGNGIISNECSLVKVNCVELTSCIYVLNCPVKPSSTCLLLENALALNFITENQL